MSSLAAQSQRSIKLTLKLLLRDLSKLMLKKSTVWHILLLYGTITFNFFYERA
jgi:hypothetical protein